MSFEKGCYFFAATLYILFILYFYIVLRDKYTKKYCTNQTIYKRIKSFII